MNGGPPTQPPRRRNDPKTLAFVALYGATAAVVAYVVGRGNVVGMVAVFAVIGIGGRIWAHWYRGRHPS